MPKDFKNSPATRGNGHSGRALFLGIAIGLVLGIALAVGVALWLNRLSNPFVERAKPIEPLAKFNPPQQARPDGAEAEKPPAEKAGAERPRFEFYTMLPGDKSAPAVPEPKPDTQKVPKEVAKEPARSGPGSSPSQPKPHGAESYWLQAGAFADQKDAENLRAKIALTGLEAAVKAAEVPAKGTLFRVRLGPYQSLEDANRIKATLSASGIGATTIRADEAKTR
jgi:cell division protein FtsN